MDNNWIALTACVMVQQKNICAMCGEVLEDNEFTLHHIKPRAEGGKDEFDNLIGLCNPCHDIAEDLQLNRKEIINGYEEPKPIKYIRKVYSDEPEQEYDYPEEIILQEKYIRPRKRKKYIKIDKNYKPLITERPSKYILKYGKSLKDIAKIFGVCEATIYNWLKDEKKKEWLEKSISGINGGK